MQLERTLALLWGDDSTPVGRTGRTIGDYIDAASKILDREGPSGLSMRAVAERLGVRVMAAYSFGKKEELSALVVDRAYAAFALPPIEGGTVGWRVRLQQVAEANQDLLSDHPWLLHLPRARSLMGPYELRKRELELSALEDTPLSDVEKDRVITHLLFTVAGSARFDDDLRRERTASSLSDEAWWSTVWPALEATVDRTAFPNAARIGTVAREARKDAFWDERDAAFGITLLLDGVESLILAKGDRGSSRT